MKAQIIFLILIVVFCSSCSKESTSRLEIIDKNKKAKIDSLLNRYLDLNRFSGVVLISNKKSIIYHESFGLANYETNRPFTDRTAFKVGEVSELITSALVNEMVHKGDFQLSDKVSDYLPEIKGEFTINNLLNHKTDLPSIASIEKQNPDLEYSIVEYANSAKGGPNESEKSELNYNILGLLIEKVSGKGFQENVLDYTERLLLKDTYLQRTDTAQEATGHLYYNYRGNGLELQESSVYDMEMAFSSRGIKSSANDLTKIVHSEPERDVEIEGYLGKDGFSYSVFYQAEDGLAIIVLSNRRHPVAKEISNSIDSIMKGASYKVPLKRDPVDINPELLNNYLGKYRLNKFVNFEVIKENDSLFVLLGPNKVALIPQSENQFYMLDNDASMRFVEGTTNKVNSVVLLNGFIDSEEKAFKIEK